jgi:uncharacterized protein
MIVHGEWLLTPDRAAIHQPTQTAVIADLHLGYSAARRRSGEAVPAQTLDAILKPLDRLFRKHALAALIIAGDLFEAEYDEALATAFQSWLRERRITMEAVVAGNHDRGLASATGLPVAREAVSLGRWRIVHGDTKLPKGPVVQGHEHPLLRWAGVSAPCYLISGNRLILPAFSRDAAGGNVVSDPRWRNYRCGAIAGTEVLDFGRISALPAALLSRLKR